MLGFRAETASPWQCSRQGSFQTIIIEDWNSIKSSLHKRPKSSAFGIALSMYDHSTERPAHKGGSVATQTLILPLSRTQALFVHHVLLQLLKHLVNQTLRFLSVRVLLYLDVRLRPHLVTILCSQSLQGGVFGILV